MSTSMNRVTLLGRVDKYPFAMKQTESGSSYASGYITVSELGHDGKEHTLGVPVRVYGRKAQGATEIPVSATVLVEGKLTLVRGKGDAWTLAVSTFEVQPLVATPGQQAQAGAAAAVDTDDIPF